MNILDAGFKLILGIKSAFSKSTYINIKPDNKHSIPPSHFLLDDLLKEFVEDNGKVDYKGLLNKKPVLTEYLTLLSDNHPNEQSWSKNEQLAYWINAYNAFTIKLIMDNYPVKSIKDIGSSINIPLLSSPWDIKFFKIGGVDYDLNTIEHKILRKQFDEPRIHFAIVCASISCPKLRKGAYLPDKLEEQLIEQAKAFINDDSRNEISAESIRISRVFNWFKVDFTKNETLIDFLNKFSKTEILTNCRVSYLEYDWNLNG